METLLGRFLNLAYRRFTAVDHISLASIPNYLTNSFDQTKSIKTNQSLILNSQQNHNNHLSLGQVSCWLTFLLLLTQISSSSTTRRPTLILEDDVDVEVDFVSRLNEAIAKAPNDWDILLCGYCHLKTTTKMNESDKYKKADYYECLHCQVVRDVSVARRLVRKLDLTMIDKPVDLILGDLAGADCLRVYAMRDQIAVQKRDAFSTEIHNSGSLPPYALKNSALDLLKNIT